MRKNILMIATVTMMAFAITACGSDSKDNETTKAETTAQVTTEEAQQWRRLRQRKQL